MKPPIILLLCALATSCNSASQPRAAADALGTVVQLYKDYSWEAVLDEPLLPGTLTSEPQSILARYFDSTLVALILKDRTCSEEANAVCNLDFLPIWDAQDPPGLTVRIVPGKDSTTVVVTVRNATRVDVSQLTYAMVRTAVGWRIHDISYNSHPSLVTLLRGEP